MGIIKHLKKSSMYRQVFGYDLFISYSRKDGLDYAYKIAEHFILNGYECYIDQLSNITPGTELPVNIYEAIERCSAFVIIGSPGTQNSYPVAEEIKTFLDGKKNRPLIPINIDSAIYNAVWYSKIQGLALINDSLDNLNSKKPTEEVLTRIQNSLTFTKKSKKLRRNALLIFLLILCAGAFAIWQSLVAIKASEMANLALQNQLNAEKLKAKAETEKNTADKLKRLAILEKEKADKASASSYLIAEGNKLAESDISKAIMCYAYAYDIDSSIITYKLIDSFYKKNTPLIESKNFDKKRFLNHFYSRINSKGAQVCISENIFYHLSGRKLGIEEFATSKQYTINLKYEYSGYITNPHSSKLIFYNLSSDPLLWSFDLRTKRTEQILRSKLVNKTENLAQAIYKNDLLNYFIPAKQDNNNYKDLQVSSSDNNRYLLIYRNEETPVGQHFFEVLIIDLKLEKSVVMKFKIPASRSYITEHFHVGKAEINNKGSLLYASTSPNDYRYLLYSVDSTFFLGSLYEGVVFSQQRDNEPTVIKFIENTDSLSMADDNCIIYGTRGGQLTRVYMSYNTKELTEGGKDDFITLVSSPQKNISQVTAIETTQDYIIAGTDKGVIHFFENGLFWEGPYDDIKVETYKNISSLQLGSISKIVNFSFDKKSNVLYAINADGEIFKLSLNYHIKLSTYSKILISQLKNSGINDLSTTEKQHFKIEN